jgi:hypothetical protein
LLEHRRIDTLRGLYRVEDPQDFETQPYPLSPHVFEVTTDGTITERA